jgi:threonine dehydrogenase-like Zn-dependent dehydrogenase
MTATSDRKFSGSIPEVYERYMVPLIFEPYAVDLAARMAQIAPKRVLEIAAGTGVLTRQLARVLPPATAIVATDLNQPMLDRAKSVGTARPVEWRTADAMQLAVRRRLVRRRSRSSSARCSSPTSRRRSPRRCACCGPGAAAVQRLGRDRAQRVRRHGDARAASRCFRAIRRDSSPALRTAITTPRRSRGT